MQYKEPSKIGVSEFNRAVCGIGQNHAGMPVCKTGKGRGGTNQALCHVRVERAISIAAGKKKKKRIAQLCMHITE